MKGWSLGENDLGSFLLIYHSFKNIEEVIVLDMKEFYKIYNLSRYYFANLIHVGTKALDKYEKGETIHEDSKKKIERAIHIIESNHLVRPEYMKRAFQSVLYRNEYYKEIRDYERTFEELFKGTDS